MWERCRRRRRNDDPIHTEVRFIIYKEEFVNRRRTAELRDCLFATESERVARRKQREFFEGEVYRYRQTYWHIETEEKNEVLIVRAPEPGALLASDSATSCGRKRTSPALICQS